MGRHDDEDETRGRKWVETKRSMEEGDDGQEHMGHRQHALKGTGQRA
jgi:hypothetical protein